MTYLNNFIAVLKSDGKILRETERGTFHLPFGCEYSILLKNNNGLRAVVDIEVDGIKALDGKLIMDANSTSEIKGFMKNMHESNKFKFIKKTQEISNFRGDRIEDGSIRIEFQLEIPSYWWHHSNSNDYLTYYSQPNFYTPDINNYRPYNTSDVVFTCSNNSSLTNSKSLEDGITVKGSNIGAKFNYGVVNSLSDKKEVITLYLKGFSKKNKPIKAPVVVRTKKICPTCGRSNKYTNNFCYNCGTCVE